MDIEKQAQYWKKGALEECEVAEILYEKRKYRHALFMVHLALEKALKSHVVTITRNNPPKSHNLLYLANLADLTLSQEQAGFFRLIQQFNLDLKQAHNFHPI